MHWNWATYLIKHYLQIPKERFRKKKFSVLFTHRYQIQALTWGLMAVQWWVLHALHRALFGCSFKEEITLNWHLCPFASLLKLQTWRNNIYRIYGSRRTRQEHGSKSRKILWGLDFYFVFIKLKRRKKTFRADLSYQNQNKLAAHWRDSGGLGDFVPWSRCLSNFSSCWL